MLRHLFFQTYDHLGSLMVLNAVWTVLNLPWGLAACLLFPLASFQLRNGRVWLGVAVAGAAICIGLVSPPTAALLNAVREAEGGVGVRVRALLGGVRRRFWAAQAVGLLLAGATGLLGVNFGAYAGLEGPWRPVGWVLLGLMLWTSIGLLGVAPMWVASAARTGRVLEGFLSAARLALAHPGLCLGTSAITGLLLLSGAATGIGLFTGAASVAGLWVVLSHEALSSARSESCDLSASRSLRELWRPWENQKP
ncbi:MAG: hypothetical protein EXS64_20660 [Candidatus Latescibacteria bacterium]|nr:hypothetical protein [Candidatus Latescibacterota bacterium]